MNRLMKTKYLEKIKMDITKKSFHSQEKPRSPEFINQLYHG